MTTKPTKEEDAETIYGRHSVEEAVREHSRRIDHILVDNARAGAHGDIIRAAKDGGVKVRYVPRVSLDRLLPGANHQGIAVVLSSVLTHDLGELLARGEKGRRVVLILDGVTDPQNLGAILRSAGAFGADFIVLPKDRSASLSPAAARVASGAAEVVPVARVVNLARAMDTLKEAGFWIYALEADGVILLQDADLRGDAAFVMGSEGSGLRRLVREKADVVCRIPAGGPIPSLNVAGAAAIVLYEAVRQRAASGK